MKPLWRSVLLSAGILLTVTTPVHSETPSQIAAPTPLTDTISNENLVEINRSTEYQTGYAQGQREAQENIAIGKPSIYTVGKPGARTVDQQTGFPLVAIAGCSVNDSILGRRDGYNDRMKELVAARKALEPSKSSFDESSGVVKPQQRSDREQVVIVKPEQFTPIRFNYTSLIP
ncbi:MAG TPA: hypothetical protein V6D14_22415 [Coleofasciculaceae cyanobacterium]|jgi:hypothetical protein